MSNKISIADFRFLFAGHGHYTVWYQSPVTKKLWHKTIDNMPLIDATKNAEEPKRKDLEELRRVIKR